jgi:ribonuclease D
MQKSPKEIAIDCEGTNSDNDLPLMVQISSPEFVIVEFPEDNSFELSDKLNCLLDNQDVVKVFFDPSGSDCRALQRSCDPKIDIATCVQELKLAPKGVNVRNMGLAEIISISTNQKYVKQSIKKNGWYSLQTGKAMRKSKAFVNYAAAGEPS